MRNTSIFTMQNIIIYLIVINIIGFFIMWLDKRPIRPMLKGILCYPLFLGSWILINIKALIKPDTTWTKIEHTRSVKVDELDNKIKV